MGGHADDGDDGAEEEEEVSSSSSSSFLAGLMPSTTSPLSLPSLPPSSSSEGCRRGVSGTTPAAATAAATTRTFVTTEAIRSSPGASPGTRSQTSRPPAHCRPSSTEDRLRGGFVIGSDRIGSVRKKNDEREKRGAVRESERRNPKDLRLQTAFETTDR
mmetsp:Transcript_2299/g.6172  ORF Transcript_2299/g.6172 Transcript_2299/m.6172 type:complete len:159 (-) Transcript_2299:11-487(-)